jgi:ankyrin repeat protein
MSERLSKKDLRKKDLNDLFVKSCSNGDLKSVKKCIKLNCKLSYDGYEGLRLSARKGHLDVFKYLVETGKIRAKTYCQAFRWCGGKGRLNIIKYLVELGYNPFVECDLVLSSAAANGHLNVIQYLAPLCDQNKLGRALASAVSEGHIQIVKYLISIGCDPTYNNYALRCYCREGYFEVAKYFVGFGYNPKNDNYKSLYASDDLDNRELHQLLLCILNKKDRFSYLKNGYVIDDKATGEFLHPKDKKVFDQKLLLDKTCIKNVFLKKILRPRSMHMQLMLL